MTVTHRRPIIAAILAVALAWQAAPALAAEQLDLVERITAQTLTDMAPQGDSVGDNITFANQLYGKDDKTLLGHDNGWCIRTIAGEAWECFRSLTLEQGQITLEGPYYDKQDSSMAVTGGTGIYLSAQGECKVHARDVARKAFDLTCTLIY
jgi:allene oxide cyclase